MLHVIILPFAMEFLTGRSCNGLKGRETSKKLPRGVRDIYRIYPYKRGTLLNLQVSGKYLYRICLTSCVIIKVTPPPPTQHLQVMTHEKYSYVMVNTVHAGLDMVDIS
jgi:hypothetical protein